MLKQQIKDFCEKKYKGALRHLKPKLFINQFGKAAYDNIIEYNKFLVDSYPLPVLVYNYLNDISQQPTCKSCNARVTFNTAGRWPEYCSVPCRFKGHVETTKKRRNTNLAKYGTANVLNSKHGRQLARKTCLEKYGVDYYVKTTEYAERIRSGNIVVNRNNRQIGVSHKTRIFNNFKHTIPTLTPLFDLEEYLQYGSCTWHLYKWSCNTCGHVFERWLNAGLKPICPGCAPPGTKHEVLVRKFLDNLKLQYIYRDRKQLGNGQEIDFYIPSLKVGIEINGLYHHQESRVGKRYHIEKTLAADAAGIQLIHIFDDEFFTKKRVVLSRLKAILKQIKRKIYARNCEVRPITNKQKSRFLEKYHIQGDAQGSIHLGLFYRKRLVAVMDFCKKRKGIGKSKNEYYELLRYATVANFIVLGGMGKLVNHFKTLKLTNTLVSYADRRWSKGNAYTQTGFTLSSTSEPNYWYTHNFTERYHRLHFQHRYLKERLKHYDPTLSEAVNMSNNKFYKIWDCGTLRFELHWQVH